MWAQLVLLAKTLALHGHCAQSSAVRTRTGQRRQLSSRHDSCCNRLMLEALVPGQQAEVVAGETDWARRRQCLHGSAAVLVAALVQWRRERRLMRPPGSVRKPPPALAASGATLAPLPPPGLRRRCAHELPAVATAHGLGPGSARSRRPQAAPSRRRCPTPRSESPAGLPQPRPPPRPCSARLPPGSAARPHPAPTVGRPPPARRRHRHLVAAVASAAAAREKDW